MKEKVEDDETAKYLREARKKQTMLQKFGIPVEHLDFKYIKSCDDVKEIERILRVLRSGEEGHFPDLEKCTVDRLESLNPKSRHLRVEVPILRSDGLGKKDVEELNQTFLGWVDEIAKANDSSDRGNKSSKEIFTEDDNDLMDLPPVRVIQTGSAKEKKKSEQAVIPELGNIPEEPGFIRAPNRSRIKSWDYDKWDKFDVDTELTKLDVQTMQNEEWDSSLDKKKLKEEQELVAKLMKNEEYPGRGRDKKPKSIFSTSATKPEKTVRKKELLEIRKHAKEIPELEEAPLSVLEELQELQSTSTSAYQKPTTTSGTRTQMTQLSTSTSKSNTVIQEKNQLREPRFSPDPSKRSFIEEIVNDEKKPVPSKTTTTPNPKPSCAPKKEEQRKEKRRFKIQIDDVHIS